MADTVFESNAPTELHLGENDPIQPRVYTERTRDRRAAEMTSPTLIVAECIRRRNRALGS